MQKKVVIRWGGWLVVMLGLLASPSRAQVIAAPIKLAWNASADPSVHGYAIYYGRTNQGPTRIDTGSNLSCTISGLVVGVTYRIYAVSYNAANLESTPSNQLLFTPQVAPAPTGPRLQLAKQSDGSMKLSCAVGTNKTCAIQFAATPTARYWQTLTNIASNPAGDILVTDTSARRVPQRFYRLALTPQPLLSAITIAPQSGGQMRLEWQAPPGARCRVIFAPRPDATLWPTLQMVTADDEGRASCLDTGAAAASSRFYRVVIP